MQQYFYSVLALGYAAPRSILAVSERAVSEGEVGVVGNDRSLSGLLHNNRTRGMPPFDLLIVGRECNLEMLGPSDRRQIIG